MTDKKNEFGSFTADFAENPADSKKAEAKVTEKKQPKEKAKPLTKRERAIRVMLRKAGLTEMPDLAELMRGKTGTHVAVKDVALFTKNPTNELLAELAKECPIRNTVNLSAEVQKARVLLIGSQVLSAKRMYQPIQIARVDGALQCTSGRHRLAFVALVYGPTAKIPAYVEEMTLCEARDAVVVANQARPTKALEKAEHAVLQAVGGDADATQDEIYDKTVKNKARARKYCVYTVIEKGVPAVLGFQVSQSSSRIDGGLTTVTNVENFWGAALDWKKGMAREEFDASLKAATDFLNAFVKHAKALKEFDAEHHLASMTMSAVGKWYRTAKDSKVAVSASQVASAVVSMGEIGRQKSERTFNAICKAVTP